MDDAASNCSVVDYEIDDDEEGVCDDTDPIIDLDA